MLESRFYKASFLIKKTPTQVFTCEYFKFLKNTYFEEDLGTAASEYSYF